jgi:hypothetical protein
MPIETRGYFSTGVAAQSELGYLGFLPVASTTSVSAPITHFVSVEVIKRPLSTLRMWPAVAVMWIETVINVAMKVVRPVKPGASSEEHAAIEPLRPIVSVGGAVVRCYVVIAVGASRLHSDIDGDSRVCRARNAQHGANYSSNKKFRIAHLFVLLLENSKRYAKAERTRRDWRFESNDRWIAESSQIVPVEK